MAVHDEFRLHVSLPDEQAAIRLLSALEAIEASEELIQELGRAAVSRDEGDVFIYTDSLARVRRAQREVDEAMARDGIAGPVQVQRWHPVEEHWERLDAPLPADREDLEHERAVRDSEEDRESRHYGAPEWEVRISLPTREAAHELADRLEAEGIAVARRSHHLLIGADDEDQARELAQRLRDEAPEGAHLEVEGSGRYYWDLLNIPPGPFAVFAGFPH